MSDVKYDMAGRPLPDRTYPAETGSEGYKLWERTLGEWLEYWAETTPDKEYIVYSDRNLRFTWSQFNERVDNLARYLGHQRTRLADVPLCYRQDWCCTRDGKHQLQAERAGIPLQGLRHGGAVYHRWYMGL